MLQALDMVSQHYIWWHTIKIHDFQLHVCKLFSDAFIELLYANFHKRLAVTLGLVFILYENA